MKTLLKEIETMDKMNKSITRVFRVLKSKYKVNFYRDEENFFIEIITTSCANTYVCYDYVLNKVIFSHTPDINFELCVDYEATASELNTTELLKYISDVLH